MSSSGFTFPPPPPPPPPTTSTNSTGGSYGQQRGGWGGGNSSRARGRGGHSRGSGRGGQMKNTAQANRGGYGVSRGGFQTNAPASLNPFQYNTPTQQNFHQHPIYNPYSPPSYSAQYAGAYASPLQVPQVHPVSQIQIPLQQAQISHGTNFGYQTQQGGFGSPHNHNTHGNKRPHQNTPNRAHNNVPQTSAPPAVPSFGIPLPVKPPPPADATQQPAKKKRKYNQLGLTPKTDEPQLSEEEDDADEEAKWTAKIPGGQLTITYKGKTSALQSAEDIAKWIEERKKRYPTMARVEEARKEAEAKKAEREAIKRQKEAEREEARRRAKESQEKKLKEKEKEKQDKRNKSIDPANVAAKARARAEKLRKKLMKEEMKAAKAEADAEKARLQSADSKVNGHMTDGEKLEAVDLQQAENGGNARESLHDHEAAQLHDGIVTEGPHSLAESLQTGQHKTKSAVDVESEPTSSSGTSDDETSSSGSDTSTSSADDSDESDSNSAPEEMTSKRQRPDRVPPPPRQDPRQRKKKVCHLFARTGRCPQGAKCKFSHERPEREPGGAGVSSKKTARPQRKSLFQALLSRQREDEDRRIMEAIVWLGERGFLLGDCDKRKSDTT
ncbi:hypothetical protein VTO42DRAFT_6636 [Malbranchea cinnamomea]